MEPLYRKTGTCSVPISSGNLLSFDAAILVSLRSVLATDATGDALVKVATRAAKAELEMYRLNEKAHAMGYVSIHAALHELSKYGESTIRD